MRNLGLSSPTLLALGAALVGCVEPVEGVGPAVDSGTNTPVEDTGTQPDGEACDTPDKTRLCACAGGDGVQVCLSSGVWSSCDCSRVDSRDSGVKNDKPCKPGYYTGSFEGEYWPGIADIGFGSLLQVSVKAFGNGSQPGLALTIDEEVEGEDTEFPIYKVGNGCIVGTARAFEGLAGDHPFVATLEGNLECATGVFTGTIKGYYQLFGIQDIPYQFAGPISATYRSEDASFTDAVWTVQEHTMTQNPPGGNGTWMASFASDTSPPLPPECLDLLNGGGPSTGGDAGI